LDGQPVHLGERGLEDRSRRRPDEQGAGDRLRSPAAALFRARAHRKAFWNAVPSKIHEVKFHGVPSPGVKRQKTIQPSTKSASLIAWNR